jgi:hypothetical protein
VSEERRTVLTRSPSEDAALPRDRDSERIWATVALDTLTFPTVRPPTPLALPRRRRSRPLLVSDRDVVGGYGKPLRGR